MKSANALINPKMLIWARQSAGITRDEAASRLRVSEEKLNSWESGEAYPTIKQLKKVANLYKQSFAAFYLPKAPPVFTPPMKDYRRLPGGVVESISTELRYDSRQALERREIYLELLLERQEQPLDFPLHSTRKRNPESLANALRENLNLTVGLQMSWSDERIAFNAWRERIESLGVLVFQSTKVPIDEMRGYSIAKFPLPVVVVNRKDNYTGRIFTLLHEVTHLIIRASGICNLEEHEARPPEEKEVEVYCNRVAGATLLPREHLLANRIVQRNTGMTWQMDELAELSRCYRVGREVVLRRLLTCQRTTKSFYMQVRKRFIEEYDKRQEQRKAEQKKKGGFTPPYSDAVSALGKPMVRLVLESLDSGQITANDVSDYLGVRLKHLSRISDAVGMESKEWQGKLDTPLIPVR